jgi:toxin ParE1/3/4
MAHRLAQEAAAELDDIWYYVAKESGSVTRADRLVAAITARFTMLARHPHIGRRRDDLRPGLRSFPVRDYVIIYRNEGADVLILHVLHGRRDIAALLGDPH